MPHFDYDHPNVNWSAIREHYEKLCSSLMKQHGLDALVLSCRDNIRMASGFRTYDQIEMGGSIAEEYAAIIDREGGAYVFQPWYPETSYELKEKLPRLKEFHYIPAWIPADVTVDFWAKEISDRLSDLKVKKIGFDHLSSTLLESLKVKLRNTEFHSVFVEILESRMVKHAEEIKMLEEAAALNDSITTCALAMVRQGVTGYQIAAEAIKKMYEYEAEFISHFGLGTRRLGAPTSRVIRQGEPVMFDIGIYWKGGYSADEARTGFVGKPPAEFMDAYHLLKETLLNVTKAITPGRKGSEIDEMLRKPLVEAGYPESPYATGHGLGLRLMELPQIDKPQYMSKDYELKENMIIAIEPETGVGRFGMKLEDEVLVKAGGGVSLDKTAFIV